MLRGGYDHGPRVVQAGTDDPDQQRRTKPQAGSMVLSHSFTLKVAIRAVLSRLPLSLMP
jgi:hypothetical protein